MANSVDRALSGTGTDEKQAGSRFLTLPQLKANPCNAVVLNPQLYTMILSYEAALLNVLSLFYYS